MRKMRQFNTLTKKLIALALALALLLSMVAAALPITPAMAGASEQLNASAPPEGYIPTPTVEKFGQADALLIQDKDVWGRNSNELALIEAGISYDLRHSCNLATIDLSEYKFIIYSSDQTQEYYGNIEANIDKIESFVSNGGLLIAHVCDQAWTPANWSGMHILPGNVQHATGIYLQDLTIADTTHPIIRGTPYGTFDIYATNPDYFDGWGWSTHGYFTNLPDGTITIIKIGSGTYQDQPTYIDYNFGNGKVLATMQTVEWGYFSGSQGWCGNRPELLRNEMRFALAWEADTTPPAAITDLRAIAIDLTSTGFVYPTGKRPTRDPYLDYGYDGAISYYQYAGWLARGGMDSDLDYVKYKYHIGQDIEGGERDPVYAIADGEIVFSHYDADGTKGWGKGNYGLFVKHELNTGEEFLALYGHVRPLEGESFAVGQQVTGGEAFAEIGSFSHPHLHFGICRSKDVPDTEIYPNPCENIGWGRMGLNHWDDPPPANTNGFVDPINWIMTQTPKSPLKPASVVLSWTAPANDDNDVGSGRASEYDIRYSTSPIITDEEWESARPCTGEPQPGDPGSMDSFVVTDLFPATIYYFALKAYDEAGNPSGLSNVTWEITAGIGWYLCSAADMIVTDPDGLTISKELNEIPGATYLGVCPSNGWVTGS